MAVTAYDVHVSAKAAALEIEHFAAEVGNVLPPRPALTDTGDLYYAKYWADYAKAVALSLEKQFSVVPL